MKKNKFYLLNLFLVLCVGLSFVSCSDDEEDNDEVVLESLIVGKWKIESSTQGVDEDEKNWIFNIKSDGTYSNGDGDEYDDLGTWSLNNKTFKYTSKLGLNFSAEILELTKTHFTAKIKNPISSGYITTTYNRVE